MARKDKRPAAAKNRFEKPTQHKYKEIDMSSRDDFHRPFSPNEPRITQVMEDLIRRTEEAKRAQLGGNYGRIFWGDDPEDVPSVDREKTIAERELRDAREPVEKYLTKDIRPTSIDEIVGNETARAELMDALLAPTQQAELYKHYSRVQSKGVLLYGPPGCGKTMFARAAAAMVAKEFKCEPELLKINASEIQSGFVGQTEKAVKAVYAYARVYKKVRGHPLVIFIDEADALLPPRSRGYEWQKITVGAFLAEMDGVMENSSFTILATNRPEALDEALLREGRCDRKIKVVRPDFEATHILLQKQLATVPTADPVEECILKGLDYLFDPTHVIHEYRSSEGDKAVMTLSNILTGAMIVGLVERCKRMAFNRDKAERTLTGIKSSDLISAIEELRDENTGIIHEHAVYEVLENYETNQAKKGLN